MTTLNRFLSKLAVRGSPFFKALRRGPQFEWTSRCQKIFDELKDHIAKLPTLTSPGLGETLFVYLAVGKEAVSTVLVREEDKVQKSVYCISRALQEAKTRYSAVEREAAEIEQAIETAEARRTKETVETEQAVETAETEQAIEAAQAGEATEAKGRERCRAGLLLINTTGEKLAYALRFNFRAFNNESEYETLIAGMEMARKLEIESIKIYSDSQLIVNQVLKNYEVKEESLKKYVAKAQELRSQFKQFTLKQVPWSRNKRADVLSKLASTSFGTLNKEVLVEDIKGRYEHLMVAIDNFTKWIEVELLNTISSRLIQKFFWRNIVPRFGIPRVLVFDNGRQFADSSFQDWCSEFRIWQHFTSVGHLQANGQWYWLRSFAYRCGLYLKIFAYFAVSVLVVELLPLNLILSCLCTSGTGCGVAYNS
ncbi:uncharacterized protein [Coffea arabica]|uniref:Integrase catalytic domain-containing protein n=1 Tax=Coffea arabica TaxID=13443 RepID=A0ABM4VKD8_COFAR